MSITLIKSRIMTSSAEQSQVAGSPRRFRMKHFQVPSLVVNVAALVASIILINSIVVQRGFNCLKISSIEIPAAVWNGSQVTLVCNYELASNDQLYSVKWYKNYVEFYRFQPQPAEQQTPAGAQSGASTTMTTAALLGGGGGGNSDDQQQQQDSRWQQGGSEQATAAPGPIQEGQNLNLNYGTAPTVAGLESKHEFELDGISLDLAKSNATHVQLRRVQLSSEATYKCEVSADSPTFATVSAERQMKVYVLPKQKLTLVDNSLGQSVHQQLNQRQQQQLAMTRSNKNNNNNNNINEPSPTTAPVSSSGSIGSGSGGAIVSSKRLIYQLNDLINFTCISGASRPGAQLSWRLNDEPILTLFSSQDATPTKANASEHQQQQPQLQTFSIREEHKLLANELIETRSTLTVRLQAAQLNQLLRRQTVSATRGASGLTQQGGTGGAAHHHPASMSILPLKLSCLAKLSVQFSSETSVLVSNGRPTATTESTRAAGQRRRNSSSSRSLPETNDGYGQRPVAASLVDGQTQSGQEPDTYSMAKSGGRRRNNVSGGGGSGEDDASDQDNDQAEDDELQPYRWPPAGVTAGRQRRPTSTGLWSVAGLSDAWRTTSTTADSSSTTGGERSSSSSSIYNPVRSGGRRNYQNEVWTSRQLAEQSEHIGQIIERSRPNELEAPHIEAKSIVAAAANKRDRDDGIGAQSMEGESRDKGRQEDLDDDGGGGGDSDDDDEEARAGGSPAATVGGASPSIVISSNQFGQDTQFTEQNNYSTTQPDPEAVSSSSSSSADKSFPNLKQDYQLDELVNFTCHPVMASRYFGQEYTYGDDGRLGDSTLSGPIRRRRPKKLLFAIQIKWFINNQEINGNKVNAIAGDRFYYAQSPPNGIVSDNSDTSDQQDRRTTPPELATFSPQHSRRPPVYADIVVSDQVGAAPNTDYSNWRHQSDQSVGRQEGDTSKHQRPTFTTTTITSASPPATSSSGANWLLIEFTPSLLQLKEFNLKCKTIVEQPLSVVENSHILSLATSPFIQVVHDPHSQQSAMQMRATHSAANGGRHMSLFNVKEHPKRQQALAAGQYQSSVGLNNYDQSASGQQHRHRSNVFRVRPSSSAALVWKIDLTTQLRLGCLLVFYHLLLAPRPYFPFFNWFI